jgi:N-acetylglutamate synthase-like GNAT family acetyltransferase
MTQRQDEHAPGEVPIGQSFTVRDFSSSDQRHVMHLYCEGLLAGHVDPFDPAADLERIEELYMWRPHRHFWVAEASGEIVGTVAIVMENDLVAHLRRLRVSPGFAEKNRVAIALVETALEHARVWGALKLAFHTPVDDGRAIELLRDLGFQFFRARMINGRHLLEFYANLYDRVHPTAAKKETLIDVRQDDGNQPH